MKIGILTFHIAHNYGAVLQTYALQEHFKSEGYKVEIIDYRPDYLITPFALFSLSLKNRNLLQFFKTIARQLLTFHITFFRYRKFNLFINKHFNLSFQMYRRGDLINPSYDAYIFGSDQIWNPQITKGYDPAFCGGFHIKSGSLKIAYAASTEGKDIRSVNMEYLLEKLKTFHAISVRESEFSGRLQQELNKTVPTVLDPTLLVPSDVFYKIVKDPKVNKSYVLCYQVQRNANASLITNKISETYNLDKITLDAFISVRNIGNWAENTSPESFLGLVKNAKYIVTTSFHGVAFSIIFRKQFICVVNKEKGCSRIKSLLTKLNLEDQMVSSITEVEIPLKGIDYDLVYKFLDKERRESYSFLQNSFSC